MTFTDIELIPSTAVTAQPASPKAKTIFTLGVMGYQRQPAAPGATFAMMAFDKLLAQAKGRGYQGSKQIKGAVRRGQATVFAMDKAQALAMLVTDAELQYELDSLTRWDRARPW
jgi:hypothetical protein